MPSEEYRYYCLDSTGQLHNSVLFEAESDEDAIRQIAAKHPYDKCEIWHGKRLVATLEPHRITDGVSSSLHRIANARRILGETAALVGRPSRPNSGGDAR